MLNSQSIRTQEGTMWMAIALLFCCILPLSLLTRAVIGLCAKMPGPE
jgi:hypothetical protein